VAFVNESHWKMTKPMPLSGGELLVAMSESTRRLKEARQRHIEKDRQKHKHADQQKRQEAQPEKKETPTSVRRRISLYERSIQEREQKEAKLQSIRKEQMTEYTFTPKLPSSSTSSRTVTTNASSSDSVFDRLYRNAGSSSIATPTSVQVRKQHSHGRTSHTRQTTHGSPYSSTASGVTKNSATSRIEELYQAGVMKARSRPRSEREEKEARERRRETKELRQCTFRPQINWTRPEDASSSKQLSMTSSKLHVQGRIGISPREQTESKTMMAPVSKQRRTPPREILVAGSSFIQQAVMDAPHKDKARASGTGTGTPWQTPVRRRRHHHHPELPISSDYTMVSPLRDPSVVEESSLLFYRDSNLPSRIPIYLTAAFADATGDNATRTDDTEYGSI
jgi:hypothetical protein